MESFKKAVEKAGVENVVWSGEDLISPFPNIKFGHRLRTEQAFLQIAMSKFSYSTVIEAMNNKKIILVL